MTGGNDNTIVIWEISDCAGRETEIKRSNNGKFSVGLRENNVNTIFKTSWSNH